MKSLIALLCLMVFACGDDDRSTDAGSFDAFGGDTGSADARVAMDSGQDDATGGNDAGESDASELDASVDTSPADSGSDVSIADAGDDAGPDSGQDAGPPITCLTTGCSGQVCAEMDTFTTCEFRPWYVCYADGVCEGQPDGACGWTPTPEFTACLAENGAPE